MSETILAQRVVSIVSFTLVENDFFLSPPVLNRPCKQSFSYSVIRCLTFSTSNSSRMPHVMDGIVNAHTTYNKGVKKEFSFFKL